MYNDFEEAYFKGWNVAMIYILSKKEFTKLCSVMRYLLKNTHIEQSLESHRAKYSNCLLAANDVN